MVDALSQTKLEHLRLKTPLQEIFNSQTQHVIELHPALIEHANSHETTQKSIAFEQPPLIFLLQCQQLSGGFTNLRQGVFYTPNFTLVAKPILSNNLQLLIQALFLEGTPRSRVGFTTHNLRHLAEEKMAMKRKEKSGRKAFHHVERQLCIAHTPL